MRNFTLGSKGMPLFLFALFLFSGTYLYGQDCPTITVDDDANTAGNQQTYCYLQTVADLQANENGDGIRWYRTAISTNPIPSNEILEDGNTYYAGNESGTCQSREAVTVKVTNLGAPTPSFGSFFQPCEYGTGDTTTVQDLMNIVDPDDPSYEIEVYTEEFSGDPLDPSVVLVEGNSYFVGQTNPAGSNCPSTRVAIQFLPVLSIPPSGDENQQFCTGATVADLQAQPTTSLSQGFRWYSTMTSNPALDASEPLVDGETYYATQITNRTNSNQPPCESRDRFAVTVELLTGDAGNPNTGIVCETDVQETFPSNDAIKNYLLALLDDGVSTSGTFSPTADQLAQQYQNDADGLGDFTTTYTLGADECAASVVLTVSIIPSEAANAGGDVALEFAIDDQPQDLYSYVTTGAQIIGSFEGYPEGEFDPAAEGPGTYTINYTVDETSGCITGTDTAVFTITVAPCEVAGEDIDTTFCQSEAISLANDIIAAPESAETLFINWIGERSTEGTFDGNVEDLTKIFTGPFPIVITGTYIVEEGGVCEDEANITVTIVEDVDAGEDGAVTLDQEDAPINLIDYLGGTPDENGTWSNGTGTFDPATDAPGTYTYTVGEGCTDSATVTVTVNTTPIEPDPQTPGYTIVCEADVQTFFPSVDETRKFYLRLLPTGVATNGTFNPTPSKLVDLYQADEDGLGEFTTIYTVGGESYELTVNIVTQAEAGTDATVTLAPGDDPVNLFDYLGEAALRGGTWSTGNGTFDPATDEPGTFTYTVGYETCMDSATVTVTLTDDPIDPGTPSPGYAIVCEADVQTLFPSVDETRKFYLRLLPTGVATNGTFNPTPSKLVDLYQADEDGLGEFTTVYTVDGESYELTVNIVTQAEAGTDATVTLAPDDEPVNLFDYLGENALLGGTWSTGNGTFDPATDEPGTFTYTVGYETCMDSATVTVNVTSEPTDPCEGVVNAGTDSSATVCETDVQTLFPSIDEIRKYYLSLLDPGVDRTGTLSPSPSQLATIYQNDEDGLGEFTATYTLTSGECSDSVELTVNIVPVEPANAGTINDFQVCSNENLLNLNDYLGEDSSKGGSFFDASGNEIADGLLDVSVIGVFEITYTVSEDDADACVTGTDSTDFTVTVGENTANAGADNSTIVCNSEVKPLSATGVRNLYLNLLEDGVATNGTFNPTIQQLIDQYNFQSNIGDFVTTYTVGTDNCTDSAQLTVTVLENPDAGQSATVNLEEGTTDTVDLFAELGGTPDTGGTWTFGGNEVDATFDPATDSEGAYTYTVTSDNGCSASAVVTIVIGEPVDCPDVTENAQTFCTGATVADLLPADAAWYSSADATDALAADTALTDGGEYYAGDAAGECTAREMVTVTIVDAPIAPTVADFSACAVTAPTVAELTITGDDGATFNVYTSDALGTPAADTDVLVEGTYYITQTSAAGCESDAAMLEVTLTDTDAPTLVQGGNVFCESARATIAELEEKVNADGMITWYTSATGNETYSSAEVLEDGVIYYASSTPTGDCESSNRLAVTVTLDTCELVIPEIFSPNGDKINDEFVIENLASEYPGYKLEIYNRWGEPVYKGNASTPDWDGTSTEGSFGSGVLPAGVYFYILYYNDGTTPPTQGRVYLSR